MIITNHARKSKLTLKMFVSALIILTATRFVVNLRSNSYLNPSTYAQVEPSARWLIGKNGKGYFVVLSDLDTSGRYLVKASRYNATIKLAYYNSEVYEKLFNASYTLKSIFDYLVINRVTLKSPIQGIMWKYYEPLSQHLHHPRYR
jgi:hypothetical protein